MGDVAVLMVAWRADKGVDGALALPGTMGGAAVVTAASLEVASAEVICSARCAIAAAASCATFEIASGCVRVLDFAALGPDVDGRAGARGLAVGATAGADAVLGRIARLSGAAAEAATMEDFGFSGAPLPGSCETGA